MFIQSIPRRLISRIRFKILGRSRIWLSRRKRLSSGRFGAKPLTAAEAGLWIPHSPIVSRLNMQGRWQTWARTLSKTNPPPWPRAGLYPVTQEAAALPPIWRCSCVFPNVTSDETAVVQRVFKRRLSMRPSTLACPLTRPPPSIHALFHVFAKSSNVEADNIHMVLTLSFLSGQLGSLMLVKLGELRRSSPVKRK